MHRRTFLMLAASVPVLTTRVSATPSETRVYLPNVQKPRPFYASSNEDFEREVIRLINVARADLGFHPLRFNAELTQAARRHSWDLARHNRYSHIGSDGSTVGDRVYGAGYTGEAAGETMAAARATPERYVSRMLTSPPHRAIALDPPTDEAGVGYVYLATSQYQTYWTVDYGWSG
jgi:uncharacterized protein YkwD